MMFTVERIPGGVVVVTINESYVDMEQVELDMGDARELGRLLASAGGDDFTTHLDDGDHRYEAEVATDPGSPAAWVRVSDA